MQEYPKKRVLVTGGRGFTGSHLCEALLERGQDIIFADNFFTGSKSNIAHLLNNSYFELLRHDITFPCLLRSMRSTTWPAPLPLFVSDLVNALIAFMQHPDDIAGPLNYQEARLFRKQFTLPRWCNTLMARGLAAALRAAMPPDEVWSL